MDRISDKTIKKNKSASIRESIARIESDITLYKSEGNRTAQISSEKVLKCLKSLLEKNKNK